MPQEVTMEEQTKSNGYFSIDDILESQKYRGMKLRIKPYDAFTFWNGVGDRYYKMFRDKNQLLVNVDWILDRLEQFQPVESLLDIGCGFGRVAPFILEKKLATKITGIDISPKILETSALYLDPKTTIGTATEKSKQVIAENPTMPESVKNELLFLAAENDKKTGQSGGLKSPDYRAQIEFKEMDVRKMTFGDNAFDATVCSEVLQHIAPDEVANACSEIVRVTKKVSVICERWAFPNEHAEPHMWTHNLCEIFQGLGAKVGQVVGISNMIQGLVIVK